MCVRQREQRNRNFKLEIKGVSEGMFARKRLGLVPKYMDKIDPKTRRKGYG